MPLHSSDENPKGNLQAMYIVGQKDFYVLIYDNCKSYKQHRNEHAHCPLLAECDKQQYREVIADSISSLPLHNPINIQNQNEQPSNAHEHPHRFSLPPSARPENVI